MPIYMNVDGVQGDVTAAGHESWIEVKSFEFGVGRGITTPVGGTKDREAGVPSVSEIVVTKDSDIATADLMKKALTGDGVTVKFDFVMTGKSQFTPFYQFELTNVLISGYSLNGADDRVGVLTAWRPGVPGTGPRRGPSRPVVVARLRPSVIQAEPARAFENGRVVMDRWPGKGRTVAYREGLSPLEMISFLPDSHQTSRGEV
jgi:type VI secretion system secreted protein Hcp